MSNINVPGVASDPMERAQGCTIKWHSLSMCNEHYAQRFEKLGF